jgi:hypothetical protein
LTNNNTVAASVALVTKWLFWLIHMNHFLSRWFDINGMRKELKKCGQELARQLADPISSERLIARADELEAEAN